jgi:hypothetical protein
MTAYIGIITFVGYDRQISQFPSDLLDTAEFENATAARENRFPQNKKQLHGKFDAC